MSSPMIRTIRKKKRNSETKMLFTEVIVPGLVVLGTFKIILFCLS